MRLAALLLAVVAVPAQAWLGSFDVCDKSPQYARIEFIDGVPAVDCPIEAARRGNYLPAALLLVGTFYVSCALVQDGVEGAAILYPSGGADAGLGHELRHAFTPREFHPPMLPFVTLPCESSH